jgi:small subunit ribosomal protein S3Ae
VKLRVYEVKDGKGLTEILGYEMMPSSVKRLVRRDRTKIDDSVVVMTSDGKKVRIKPLLITNSVVNAPVATSIRNKVRNNLARFAAKLTYDKLVEEILTYKIQKYLGNLAADITPIRTSEIRAFILVEREDVAAYKPGKEEEVREEEEMPGEEEKKEESAEKAETTEKIEAEETEEIIANNPETESDEEEVP